MSRSGPLLAEVRPVPGADLNPFEGYGVREALGLFLGLVLLGPTVQGVCAGLLSAWLLRRSCRDASGPGTAA